MGKNNYLNYCAVIILVILIVSTIFRKLTHGKRNFYFMSLIVTVLLSAVSDTFAVILDNSNNPNMILRYFTHTSYLIFHSITTPMYVLYIAATTDIWHKIKRSSQLLMGIPIITVLVLLIVNMFNDCIFTFIDGVYTRGRLFWVLYIAAFTYTIIGIAYIIIYRKLMSKLEFIALLSIFPFTLTALLIQMFNPSLCIELFANACALLFISTMVQKPEEIIDIYTGLNKFNAYAVDMKRTFSSGKSVDIILINISNFNTMRDILGYDGMNNVLNIISKNLMKINKKMRAEAELYYLDRGKFRFVIHRSNSDITEITADEINNLMKTSLEINDMKLSFVTYICIAHCPEDVNDFQTLIAFGNDIDRRFTYTGDIMYASEMLEKKHYDIMQEINSIIENAIVNNKFQVYYQPIYSIEDKRFNSAEALLRLIDDKYGFISPELFIPAAEKSGAIHRIGSYVLENVCRFIASDEFKKLNIDYIEVNLSVAQCMNNKLADNILAILDKYNISTKQINLEITETAASTSQQIMSDNLKKLYEAGICFSLDDFGTGYSNMRRVASLPLKIVKLDKTFVNALNNEKMAIVLQNTIKMLKAMNMEIVVEGVETKECLNHFSELHCEYIQGYYFSKPIPEDKFTEFIKNSLTVHQTV